MITQEFETHHNAFKRVRRDMGPKYDTSVFVNVSVTSKRSPPLVYGIGTEKY